MNAETIRPYLSPNHSNLDALKNRPIAVTNMDKPFNQPFNPSSKSSKLSISFLKIGLFTICFFPIHIQFQHLPSSPNISIIHPEAAPDLSGFGGFLLGLRQQLLQFLHHLPRLLLLHSELLQPDALALLLATLPEVPMHGGSSSSRTCIDLIC